MRGREALVPLAAVLAVLGAAWLFFVSPRDTDKGHLLYVETPQATNVIRGTEVREGSSRPIGVVDELGFSDGGRAARLGLRIDDDAWPLPRGTRVAFRAAGTVTSTNRYLEMIRPRGAAPPLPDGATLPRRDVATPVEFDEFVTLFDRRTQSNMRRFIDVAGPSMSRAEPHLTRALGAAPPAVRQARLVVHDVAGDLPALDSLVVTTDRVVDSVRRADPGLASLLQGASTTFQALGAQAGDVRTALARLPGTMRQTRATLGRATTTLTTAGSLLHDLGPGVSELRRLAAPLNDTLRGVEDVSPDVTSTLATLRRAAPDVTALLDRATTQAPRYTSIGKQATEVVGCIRPYAPEIAGFFSTWADFSAGNDGVDRIARVQPQSLLPAPTSSSPYTPEQAMKVFPGLTYAFPRPPGLNAGQPWFQPQCGAGKDALDPSKDQEAKTPSPGAP